MAAVGLAGALIACSADEAPNAERTSKVRQAANPVGLTFRVTGVRVDPSAWSASLSLAEIGITTNWDNDPPPVTFACGDALGPTWGVIPCVEGFRSLPEYYEENNWFSALLSDPEAYRRYATVEPAPGPVTLDVELGLFPYPNYFLYPSGSFRLAIDPVTREVTPSLPGAGVCGFRHGGVVTGSCSSQPCVGPSCSQECALLSRGWELCYTIDFDVNPTGLGDANCDGLDDDGDGAVDEDYIPAPMTCGVAACESAGTMNCVGGALVPNCTPGQPLPFELCNGVDDDCDESVDEDYPAATTSCGIGACSATGTLDCIDGALVDNCTEGSPTPEVVDSVDNDCDGQVDECAPGQTDWWCCSQTGTVELAVDVVPGADQSPPPACVPSSVSPGATCTLRGAFELASQVAANGCSVNASVAAGAYPLDAPLFMTRGRLSVSGAGSDVTSIEGSVPPGECAALCVESCSASCYSDGVGPYACPLSCDSTCNRLRDRFCEQACTYGPRHRLIDVVADPGEALLLDLSGVALRGGYNRSSDSDSPQGNANFSTAGGAVRFAGGTLHMDRVLVENNWGGGWGVGLAASASNVTITDSVFRNNVNDQVGNRCQPTTGTGGGVTARGGGIWVGTSTTVIERSAIVGNVSADGGGIAAAMGGSLVIRNSTISGNTAPGRGGGLLTEIDTVLEFNTIALNRAGYSPLFGTNRRGGGLAVDVAEGGRILGAFGNIIAGNVLAGGTPARSSDCSIFDTVEGAVLEHGGNLIQSAIADCAALVSPLDITSSNPWLAPSEPISPDFAPADADSVIHSLDTLSPAIGYYPPAGASEAGAPPCPVYDQRGYLRDPVACDLGAFEANGVPDSDGDGIGDPVDPEPSVFSDSFSDLPLSGTTSGSIVLRNGNVVAVREAPIGVAVAVSGTGAPVRIAACGGITSIPPGGSSVVACPPASGFTPESLAPLAWYRATPGSVIRAGTAVTEWRDSSGNGHHLVQANAAARPQYSETGWNGGLPAVAFDGVDDFLQYTGTGPLLHELAGEDRSFSVLVTWEPTDLDADRDLVQWDNGGENGGNSLIELRTNSTGPDEAKYRHRRGDGVASLLNTGTVKVFPARRTTAFVFDGTALSIYDGGATHLAASANDLAALTLVRFRLGAGDNAPLAGRVAEIVIARQALGSAVLQQYRAYAQQQWGGLP